MSRCPSESSASAEQLMRLCMAMATIGWFAPMVVAWRLSGLFWGTRMPRGEAARMIVEKGSAFTSAGLDATRAMTTHAPPVAAMLAALEPISLAVEGNHRRLSRHGLRRMRPGRRR